jgi:ketosteroid isomerase-like protein
VDNAALAQAAFDAAAAGDVARFQSFFAPDAIVWHNFDQVEQPAAVAVAQLGGLLQMVAGVAYEDRRYLSVPDGAVLQHTSCVTRKDGKQVRVHTMIRMYVRDGLIQRIEEYFDTAAASAVMAP